MMVPLLLQTSLVLWLAQQTLQGGVKPQSVSWGRVLPARGVGNGAQPAGVGALGAMANRYGSKAMKTGAGQYPAAPLGAGGVGSLGLGSRGGLQPGYGSQGVYGPGVGNGVGLRTDLANGLGLSQGAKPGYGAAAGAYPVNGAFAGLGYRAPHPGSSSSPLGQAGPDLGKAKLKGLGYQYGADKIPDLRRGGSPTGAELHAGSQYRGAALLPERKVKGLDQSGLGPRTMDLQNKPLAKSVSGGLPVPKRKSGDFMSSGGLRQQDLVSSQVQRLGSYPASAQQSPKSKWYQENLGSESRRQFVPQQQLSKDQKPYAGTSYQAQWNSRSQASPALQRPQIYSSAVEERQRDLNLHGAGSVGSQGPYGLRQAAGQGANFGALAGSHKVKNKDASDVSQRGRDGSRSLGYFGGAGNYLGANPGALGYGAGLTQGGYLGGAAGKQAAAAGLGAGIYPQGARGYDDGAAGYQGAMDANGYGYGNGYSDGYRAALNSRGYAGQSQGVYGALGTGLDPTGGKYAGAGQVPYGATPMIPSGLEADAGYQYGPQQLSLAEGSKSASKQGYGAQLGASQAALGEQAAKYNGGNGAMLANGFKG